MGTFTAVNSRPHLCTIIYTFKFHHSQKVSQNIVYSRKTFIFCLLFSYNQISSCSGCFNNKLILQVGIEKGDKNKLCHIQIRVAKENLVTHCESVVCCVHMSHETLHQLPTAHKVFLLLTTLYDDSPPKKKTLHGKIKSIVSMTLLKKKQTGH